MMIYYIAISIDVTLRSTEVTYSKKNLSRNAYKKITCIKWCLQYPKNTVDIITSKSYNQIACRFSD